MNRSMKTILAGALSAAMLAAPVVALPTSASAETTVRADGSYDVAQNWRGGNNWQRGNGPRGPGWRGPGYHRGPGWNRGWRGPGYYGGRYYNDAGAAVAAGVIGLAAGAIIAGSMNQQRYATDYISYCSQRYRSFNPNTGMYTGYDGYQHRCVAPN